VFFAVGHGDAVAVTEELVHVTEMIEDGPALGRIFGSAGNEKGAGCHEGLELDQIMPAFSERFVGSGARAFGTDEAGLARKGGIEAEIPGLLVIDALAGFIKDDAGI